MKDFSQANLRNEVQLHPAGPECPYLNLEGDF
jgi:hypothetical protein